MDAIAEAAAIARAQAIVLADLSPEAQEADFARVTHRLLETISRTVEACAGPDDTAQEAAALQAAQARAATLKELAVALHFTAAAHAQLSLR